MFIMFSIKKLLYVCSLKESNVFSNKNYLDSLDRL